MSTKRTYIIETSNIVVIKTICKKELEDIESSLTTMIYEKLSRLKSHLSSCEVTLIDSIMVIQDKLGIVSEIKEVIEAYGMKIIKIENQEKSDLKGNVYVVSDELLQLFDLILGNNQLLRDAFSSIYHLNIDLINGASNFKSAMLDRLTIDNVSDFSSNQKLKEMIDAARNDKEIRIKTTERSRITDYDGRTISKAIVSTTSDEEKYKEIEDKFRKHIESINTNHQKNIGNNSR